MIRQFKKEDSEKVYELFKQNCPRYFDILELTDLKHYLEHEIEDYFVVEQNDKIIGAGGINYFPKEYTARISWDVIHPKCQGRGIGRELTNYRISIIMKNPSIKNIVVRTTQIVFQFYEKLGFELEKVEKDFWAKGFDLYQLKIELNK